MTDLIEYHQYLKAGLFNELGLNSNYNMKRESINSNESQLNDDMLHPLIDDMLKMRKEFCEQVNEMFGTEISVDFDSAWKDNEIENEVAIEAMEMQGEGSPELTDETDNIEAAPEEKEDVLIDESENEQTSEEEFEEDAAETEDTEVTAETDILPEIVEPIVEALEDIKDAIEGDEPAEEVKESDE